MTERLSTSASSLCVDCVFVCDSVRVVSESAGNESLLHFQLRFGTCSEPRGEGGVSPDTGPGVGLFESTTTTACGQSTMTASV